MVAAHATIDTRSRILKAARRVFLRDGYQASLETVAEEAGVARRTLFYNFESKEKLLHEIVDEMTADSAPALSLAGSADLRTNLQRFAKAYVEAVTSPETLMIYRILLSGAPGLLEKMRVTVDRNFARIAEQLGDCFREQIVAGEMRAVNVRHAAEMFLAAIMGFARIQMMMGVAPDESSRAAYVRAAVDTFLDGVRAQVKR